MEAYLNFTFKLEALCESYGIKCKPTSVQNPHTNAILERMHQVITMLCNSELDMANSQRPPQSNQEKCAFQQAQSHPSGRIPLLPTPWWQSTWHIHQGVWHPRQHLFQPDWLIPTPLQLCNHYLMVMVEIDSSTILVEPLKNCSDSELTHTYSSLITWLHYAGIIPHKHILDNEISIL
jgi:hypothetical protein